MAAPFVSGGDVASSTPGSLVLTPITIVGDAGPARGDFSFQGNANSDTFVSDEIGNQDDRVEIRLRSPQTVSGGDVIQNGDGSVVLSPTVIAGGGYDTILYAESWEVEESVLQQPSHWTVRIGFDYAATDLYQRYPKGTPFQLYVMGQLQATGKIDRRRLEMRRGTAGSDIVFYGRDALAPLHDGYVIAHTSFSDATYQQMVERALTAVGLDKDDLTVGNGANRKLKAGVPVTLLQPDISSEVVQVQQGVLGQTEIAVQAKVGERWLEFLRKRLDRAGLMLWAAADGTFVLSTPNGGPFPTYKLWRKIVSPGETATNQTNILDSFIDDDGTHRHTEAVIYGRGGGKKFGRPKMKGSYIDQEMVDLGYDQPIVFRDVEVQTDNQASYFARRKLAEERRDGWHVEYTVAGHTLPVANGSSTARAVITVDTTIDLDDDLMGLHGVFYIEGVRRSRGPQTETTIRLMRIEDLVFGDLSNPATTGLHGKNPDKATGNDQPKIGENEHVDTSDLATVHQDVKTQTTGDQLFAVDNTPTFAESLQSVAPRIGIQGGF